VLADGGVLAEKLIPAWEGGMRAGGNTGSQFHLPLHDISWRRKELEERQGGIVT